MNKNICYVYRLRLTVVGVGSEEVSAVTRLRMTSMVGRHIHTALTGILFGLSICSYFPQELTTDGREGKSMALGEQSSFRTPLPKSLDSNFTGESLLLFTRKYRLFGITADLTEYPESIVCSGPLAMNH